MKILVKTKGSFQLLVEDTGELVRSEGVSVVRPSPWLGEKIARDQVESLGKVSDDATQAAYDDTLTQSNGDETLAVASFLSEFPVDLSGQGGPAGAGAVLPRSQTVNTTAANLSGQTAGLAPDVKPADAGEEEGPAGPKDTNVPAGATASKPKGK